MTNLEYFSRDIGHMGALVLITQLPDFKKQYCKPEKKWITEEGECKLGIEKFCINCIYSWLLSER